MRKQREDHRLLSKLTQGTPLPIRWITRAEQPKKRDKRGPGRPRKIHGDKIEVIEIDQESGESDGEICTGEGALPLPKTKCMYTVHQNKHVVVIAREEAVTTASKYFKIPRISINRWMVGSYFDNEHAKGGNRKGHGRRLGYNQAIEDELLPWFLESHDLHLPVSKMIFENQSHGVDWS